jgi:hypothetical protein
MAARAANIKTTARPTHSATVGTTRTGCILPKKVAAPGRQRNVVQGFDRLAALPKTLCDMLHEQRWRHAARSICSFRLGRAGLAILVHTRRFSASVIGSQRRLGWERCSAFKTAAICVPE